MNLTSRLKPWRLWEWTLAKLDNNYDTIFIILNLRILIHSKRITTMRLINIRRRTRIFDTQVFNTDRFPFLYRNRRRDRMQETSYNQLRDNLLMIAITLILIIFAASMSIAYKNYENWSIMIFCTEIKQKGDYR